MAARDVMDVAQGISLGIGVVVGITVILGVFYRRVLVPALEKDLIQPMRETHKAVTTNGHTNPKDPTLKDDVRDALAASRKVQADLQSLRGEIRGLTGQFDRHLDWSVDTVSRLEAKINGKADKES